MRVLRTSLVVAVSSGGLLLAGCGVQRPVSSVVPAAKLGVAGRVHGGQQPVYGSTIQLYTVGTTGDGSAATPLLTQTVTTDVNGEFNITGLYSCTSATEVYITATGGQPTASTTNANLAMMTALGACSSLSASTFVTINEVTTVGAVAALAPYMTSYSAVGSGTSDAAALAAAFTMADAFADPAAGVSPGPDVPSGYEAPSTEINSLANVIAACLNSSGGVSGDGSACGSLFALTTPTNGSAPTNSIAALLNVANNPALNTASLYYLAATTAPFQPTLTTAPVNFQIQLMPLGGSAALTVSPAGLTFSSTSEGYTSAAQTVTILNSGTGAVMLDSIGIVGSDGGDFAETNSCGSTLAQGVSCTVSVTFTPVLAGLRAAQLEVASSVTASPAYVPLSGLGVAALAGPASMSPSSVTLEDFIGTGTETLTNNGTKPLAISSITVTQGFVQTNNCGSVLAASASCVITLAEDMPAIIFAGDITGTLTVADNSTSSPQTATLYTGFDYSSAGYLSYMGQSAIGVNSPITEQYPGEWSGPENYTVASISTLQGGGFYFPTSVLCNSYCNVNVDFKPTVLGLSVATLGLYNSLPYFLYGLGEPAGPFVSFVPAMQNTGSSVIPQTILKPAGSAPVLETGQIVNTGNQSVSLTGSPRITFTGPNASDFSVVTDACSNPGSCNVSFMFSPTGPGVREAMLNVTDSISGKTFQTPIAATATAGLPTLSTTSLTFPATHLGAQSSQTFTVSTEGSVAGDALTISSSAPYSVSPTTCAAHVSSCSVTVTYSPTSATAPLYSGGVYNTASDAGTVTVKDTTTNGTATVALVGTPGIPSPTVTASTLNFATIPVGTSSSSQTVVVGNAGDGYLLFYDGSSAIIGPTPATTTSPDFSVTTGSGTVSLAPGASASGNGVAVTFAPKSNGVLNAELELFSNAAGSPTLVAVDGTGSSGSAVSLSGSSVTFPTQNAGTTSSPTVITLTNTGTATLVVSGVSIVGAVSGNFSETNTCGSVVASGTCTISVTFAPTTGGVQTASVQILSNAPSSPDSISLTGTGVGVGVSTTALSYFIRGAYQDVTLTNYTGSAISILSLTETDTGTISGGSGADSGNFLIQGTTCGSSLPAGSTCVVTVMSIGVANESVFTGTLTIANSSYPSQLTVSLRSQCGEEIYQAGLPFNSSTISFGYTLVGSPASQTVDIALYGTPESNYATAVLAGANPGDFATPASCSGIGCPLALTFTPTNSGVRTAHLLLDSTNQYILLTGNGVNSGPVLQLSSPNAVVYDTSNGYQPTYYTVKNIGNSTLTVSSVSFTGGDSPYYSQTNNCASVAPNASCTIVMSYSLSFGSSTTLQIISNSPSSPDTVAITGEN